MKRIVVIAWFTALVMAIQALSFGQEGGIQKEQELQPESQPAETPSVQKSAFEITGIYIAQGVNLEGRPYELLLEIKHFGDVYRLTWRTKTGEMSAEGIGILENDAQTLSVGIHGPESIGVVIYRFDQEASWWIGTWTNSGNGMLNKEVLNKLEELSPEDESAEPEGVVPQKPKRPSPSPGMRIA